MQKVIQSTKLQYFTSNESFISFSVFGEIGQFTKPEHGRPKYPRLIYKFLAGTEYQSFKSTFDLVTK